MRAEERKVVVKLELYRSLQSLRDWVRENIQTGETWEAYLRLKERH